MEYVIGVAVAVAIVVGIVKFVLGSAKAKQADEKAFAATAELLEARRELFRYAVENKCKVRLAYVDPNGRRTTRTIEPFFADRRMVEAFCGSRKDLRHFTYERMVAVKMLDADDGGDLERAS